MLRFSVLAFFGLLCVALGWEPGTEYTYKFTGRSVAGMYSLKQQNAVFEVQSRVLVQSHDDSTLAVKISDYRVKRNGNYLDNPFFSGDEDDRETRAPLKEIDGEEDEIVDSEDLSTPFIIKHDKGSFVSLQLGSDEPLWISNIKKSIASQLQLDMHGVRPDGEPVDVNKVMRSIRQINEDSGDKMTAPTAGATIKVFEDTITGDCSTTISINRLTASQVYGHRAYGLKAFESFCKGKPAYEIVKNTDRNRCKNIPVHYSAEPATDGCSSGKADCGGFMQRSSMGRLFACGEFPQLNVIHAESYNGFQTKPFATNTEQLTSSIITNWELDSKESIHSRLAKPANAKQHDTLAYVFPEVQQADDDDTSGQPRLSEAHVKSPIPVAAIEKNIMESLRSVAKDLQEKPDSEQDNAGRLDTISHAIKLLSYEELQSVWKQIKQEDQLAASLLVDCAAQAGSNPAIMLIKDLVVREEITGWKAKWAIADMGYHAKTPTSQLIGQLIDMMQKGPFQSRKSLRQTALVTLADLVFAACGDVVTQQRFSHQLANFCDRNDDIVVNQLMPLLAAELEQSESAADRIVALTAIGYLGFEEIIPLLQPYISGKSSDSDETAERMSAILALQRVAQVAPERVHPMLIALASNNAEATEVRMAASYILLSSNAPATLWQRLAISTWYEQNSQVGSFLHSMFRSLAALPPTSSAHEEMAAKASSALDLVKPSPQGLPYSASESYVYYNEDQELAVMVDTPRFRVADQQLPVFMANRYTFQYGSFAYTPISLSLWNYDMSDIWENILSKFGDQSFVSKQKTSGRARLDSGLVKDIWDKLHASPRPTKQRAGLLHVNVMGSVNQFYNLEKIEESLSAFISDAMKNQKKPFQIDITKYGQLSDYNVQFATDLGLPLRYVTTISGLASLQGPVKADGQGGIQSDVNAQFTFKVFAELRAELPFNGNYIATGIDVRAEARAPKNLNFRYANGVAKVAATLGNKPTDIFYYHVKPYTVSRNLLDKFTPVAEEQSGAHIISVKDDITTKSLQLGDAFGVNLKLAIASDLDHKDQAIWKDWLKVWSVAGPATVAVLPSSNRYRKLVVRYEPEGTKARSLQTWFQYQYAMKTSTHAVVFQSGSSQPRSPSTPEVTTYTPMAPEFKKLAENVLKNIESGNARLLRAGLTAEQRDGKFIHFNSTLALAKDAWYTKDYTDMHIEKYTTTGPSTSGNKKTDFSVCYYAVRNWNKPPSYGFSKDVLYLTDDEVIGFGEQCDQSKIRFKAKVYRDDKAAKAALNSEDGQQCKKDMAAGFKYGSPACSKARNLDQTYNIYELSAEAEHIPQPWSRWVNSIRNYLSYALYPYTVEHRYEESNPPNRASWTIKRDPLTGESNMTLVRPTETLIANNIPISDDYIPSAAVKAMQYAQVFYPLNAESNFLWQAANISAGGASEAKCYVGSDAVYTFDGAFYKYTIDQCDHVLLTDCSKKSELAVLTRQQGDHKIVQVIYGKDKVEVDPMGYVTVNGAKKAFKNLDKESRFEIRDEKNERIRVVVYPTANDGIFVEVRDEYLFVKVQGEHVQISAPLRLRGRTCGICGDYDQETDGEFKTADRCVLSSGELMAKSFKLESGEGCAARKRDQERAIKLKKEREQCQSADQFYRSYLPKVDLSKPTPCTRYEKLTYDNPNKKINCESTELVAQCQPKCQPSWMVEKSFTFKCSGSAQKDFTTVLSVPVACISN